MAAINCYTPLVDVHEDPFMVDTRSQKAACEAWATEHGGTVTAQWVTHRLETRLVARWLPGVDVAVAPSRRVLERAVADVEAFTAALAAAGVPLEFADAPEPAYTTEMIANIHRRHSLPTAGYDGR